MTDSPPPPPDEPQNGLQEDIVARYRREEREAREWSAMAGVGIEFLVAVGFFAAIGYGLDRWLDSSPWLLVVGTGLGFAIGLYQLIRVAKRSFK